MEGDLPSDQEHLITKNVTMWAWSFAFFYHRIDVENKHSVRTKSDGKTVKQWTEIAYGKDYAGDKGVDSWTSYRFQLEEFVAKIRRKPGSGVWVEAEDSISQMKTIDTAYTKAGLPVKQVHQNLKRQDQQFEQSSYP